LPVIVISVIVLIKVLGWMKKERKKRVMSKKLSMVQQKMYNSKFNFMKF